MNDRDENGVCQCEDCQQERDNHVVWGEIIDLIKAKAGDDEILQSIEQVLSGVLDRTKAGHVEAKGGAYKLNLYLDEIKDARNSNGAGFNFEQMSALSQVLGGGAPSINLDDTIKH